ncbi:hypothetical protein PAMP_005092 [Pampus punctatissimus]
MGMDAAMVTYIGGLHSPPVSQPTAIHQDIQLGEEEGTGRQSLRSGSFQARLTCRNLMTQILRVIQSELLQHPTSLSPPSPDSKILGSMFFFPPPALYSSSSSISPSHFTTLLPSFKGPHSE